MGYKYLITGDAASKTTSALGLILRVIGHRQNVLMVQMLKWNQEVGEYQVQFMDGIKDYLTVKQYGRMEWHDGLGKLNSEDRNKCLQALTDSLDYVNKHNTNLLVMDELNLAYACKLLTIEEIRVFLSSLPEYTNVILTGRGADDELIKLVDVANKVVELKAPKKFICEKGIQW